MTDEVKQSAGPEDAVEAEFEASAADADREQFPATPWIALLIGLIVLLGGGYYWAHYIQRPLLEKLSEQVRSVTSAQQDMDARIEDNRAQIESQQSSAGELDARMATLAAAQGDLEGAVKALYATQSQSSLDWILAEAEYLISTANQRLALAHDVATAIAALKAADSRVRNAQHPELLPLREQLARDIAALEAVSQADVEGLALYLADAVTRVESLPTKPIADIDMSFSRMSGEHAQAENWRGMARALWADLKSLVEVKDGELEDGVLFDPELRYFLQQNLRLELSSARLAVLRQDTANFRAASGLITKLLEKYYDTANAGVSALIARLDAAQTLELSPPLPSIAGSLDAVRAKREALRDQAVNEH